jgi:anti-sigma factor RsiW
MTEVADVPCNEFVELVTDYLEDALSDELVRNIDAHLEDCAGCRSVLAQWRLVVRITGRLAETAVDQLDADTRQRLMASFQQRHGG